MPNRCEAVDVDDFCLNASEGVVMSSNLVQVEVAKSTVLGDQAVASGCFSQEEAA